jgi:hypothetical protein
LIRRKILKKKLQKETKKIKRKTKLSLRIRSQRRAKNQKSLRSKDQKALRDPNQDLNLEVINLTQKANMKKRNQTMGPRLEINFWRKKRSWRRN